jgi:import inner membrane translocase subunit TIM23
MDTESRGFDHLDRPLSGGGLFDDEPDYLDYNFKGRPYYEKLFYNAGFSYIAGSLAGGILGGSRGLASAPSSKLRVRMNGFLNGAGKYGSRGGNAMGVLALYYTTFEKLVDMSGVDEYTDDAIPFFSQMTAGTATGILYKATKRPTTMLLAGVVGGGIAGGFSYAEYLWNTKQYR